MSDRTTPAPARPAVDPEIAAFLATMPAFPPLSTETLPAIRPYASAPPEPLLQGRNVRPLERSVRTRAGPDLPIPVLAPQQRPGPPPRAPWPDRRGRGVGD